MLTWTLRALAAAYPAAYRGLGAVEAWLTPGEVMPAETLPPVEVTWLWVPRDFWWGCFSKQRLWYVPGRRGYEDYLETTVWLCFVPMLPLRLRWRRRARKDEV